MPFIGSGIYNDYDSDDDLFESTKRLKTEFTDVDTTFFNRVIIYHRRMSVALYGCLINPFFVKNDVLYCAGMRHSDIHSDTKLHWFMYDIKQKTYTESLLEPPNITMSEDSCYICIPFKRISGLKFYCAVFYCDKYDMGSKCYFSRMYIIDYAENLVTDIPRDIYVTNSANFRSFNMGPSGKIYVGTYSNSTYDNIIDISTGSMVFTYVDYKLFEGQLIHLRSTTNGTDEAISISYDTNQNLVNYETSIKSVINMHVRTLQTEDDTITSSALLYQTTNALGTDYTRYGEFSTHLIAFAVYPVDCNYKNIHTMWITGLSEYPAQLVVTGKTDVVNKIQPLRLIAELNSCQYINNEQNIREYLMYINNNNSSGMEYEQFPPYIPDLDKHVMYGLTYKCGRNIEVTEKTSVMVRVSCDFLDELDAKGGEIW